MKKIALFQSEHRPEAAKWVKNAALILRDLNCTVMADPIYFKDMSSEEFSFIIPLAHSEYENQADFVISFGGDGTMLSAARMLVNSGIPIMGVNVGKLGFLAEFSVNNLYDALRDLVANGFRVVERTVIETYIGDKKIFALNDLVIEKKGSSKLITVQAYSNGNFIGNYRADGLIISTPTGSTAYSLSCGGPIMSPGTSVLCLTPISPHTLTLRPLVISDTTELRLQVHSASGFVNVVADGQMEFDLMDGGSLVIKKSATNIKLIKPLNSSYFDLLRDKLLWGTDGIQGKDL